MSSSAATLVAIPVGKAPTGVAIAPDGRHAYVTNQNSGTVSVIDTATNTVIATVTVGARPFGVAVTPDGRRVYVSNFGSATVVVIDSANNTVTGAPIAVGANPGALAVTPDGGRVYVANFGSGTVSAIATASNTVTGAAVTVGTEPGGLAVTPDGRRVYVSNQESGTVHVIDTASNTVTGAPIAVGGHPTGLAITPDGHRVYVPDFQLNRVSVIDTATNAVIATVPANNGPFGAAVTPDGRSAYVANFGSGTVSAIDTASNSVTAIVSVGTFPFRLAITPDGRRLYVTNQESGTATVIPTLPVVNAITPTQGPTIGGTQVTIAGTMLSGATAVHFGSSPASSLFVDAAGTQALAVAPVGGAGPVPVTVTTPGGTSRPVSFTYFVPAPTISAIAPAQGPTTGGTQVIITGSNLDGATAVKFGTVPATNVLVNPGGTQVIAHGPVGSAGTVPVTVTTPGGTSNPVSFTYLVPPTISALTPPQGRVAGGTQVTIDGTNMNGATAVNFGPNPAPSVFSGSAAGTLLITTSPAGTAGEVPVTVTTPAGTSNPVTYTYV